MRERLAPYVSDSEPFLERFAERDLVIEVRANRMPDGGIVTTFTDITPSVEAAEALERANETLERRVRERTEELTRLNAELGRAKADAEEANISKTRFLAAASHDILQPLNAARLYVTSLVERQGGGEDARLVGNIDASLDAVEEILGALLDISRLDTGAMKPEIVSFRIDELLRQLEVEFAPLAREKGLELTFVPCSLARALRPPAAAAAAAEPRLQRDQIHAARPRAGRLPAPRGKLRIDVYDTGLGIPQSKKRRDLPRISPARRGRQGGARPGPRAVDRRAHRARARPQGRSAFGARAAARSFSVEVPLSTRGAVEPGAAGASPASIAASSPASSVLCIDNEPDVLDGMETLLGGWGCRVLKAPDLAVRDRPRSPRRRLRPTACWSTITSTTATASTPSSSCAAASAPTCRRS